jgi:hypothetical protein
MYSELLFIFGYAEGKFSGKINITGKLKSRMTRRPFSPENHLVTTLFLLLLNKRVDKYFFNIKKKPLFSNNRPARKAINQ